MTMEQQQTETEAPGGQSRSTVGLGARLFPVLQPPNGCPHFVRWDALDEGWALRIHHQTLERLADRGGLSPAEIFINVRHLRYYKVPDVDAVALCHDLAPNAKLTGQGGATCVEETR